jgi:hypothetical protein
VKIQFIALMPGWQSNLKHYLPAAAGGPVPLSADSCSGSAGTRVHLIDECDAVRSLLNDALADIHDRLSLDVIFTADKRWTEMEEIKPQLT